MDPTVAPSGTASVVQSLDSAVRPPLEAIVAASRLLLSGELAPDARALVEAVEGSADTALGALAGIADVLTGVGGVEVPFSPADVVREAVRGSRPAAVERGVRLAAGGLGALPERVAGDPGRLRRALVHLIREGVNTVSPGRVQVAAAMSGNRLRIAVRTIGVPDTRVGVDGWVAGELVRSLGGTVERRRRDDEHLAAFSVPVAPAAAAEPGVPLLPDRSVRLVGGEGEVGRHLVDILAGAGFRMTDDGRPDLVVVAPAGDPFTAARAVLSELPGAPVLLVVARGEHGDAAECLRLGVAGYLPQPISGVDLVDAARILAAGGVSEGLLTRHSLRERRRPLRVVIADDSPTARATLLRALEDLGHDATGVATGEEAVEAALGDDVDALIVGVDLPGIDGLEVTRRVRARRGEGIRIVGVSAHAFRDDRERCLAAGMDEHVSKPLRLERLHPLLDPTV